MTEIAIYAISRRFLPFWIVHCCFFNIWFRFSVVIYFGPNSSTRCRHVIKDLVFLFTHHWLYFQNQVLKLLLILCSSKMEPHIFVADHDITDSTTNYKIEDGYILIILHSLLLKYFANNHNKSISVDLHLWFIYFIKEELLILAWQYSLVFFKTYWIVFHLHTVINWSAKIYFSYSHNLKNDWIMLNLLKLWIVGNLNIFFYLELFGHIRMLLFELFSLKTNIVHNIWTELWPRWKSLFWPRSPKKKVFNCSMPTTILLHSVL